MRNVISVALTTFIAAFMACNQEGCRPAESPDKSYSEAVAACAATAPSLTASCECRKAVDEAYGLCDHPEWPRVGRCDYLCD